jgi:hypothetical protein
VPHLELDPGVIRVELPRGRMKKPRRYEAKDSRSKYNRSTHVFLLDG